MDVYVGNKPTVTIGQIFHIKKTKLLFSQTNLATARLDLNVPREFKLYSPRGHYLQVNYDIDNDLIVGQYVLENHTDKYSDFKFSDSELQTIVKPQIHSKLLELLFELKPLQEINQ